MKYIICIAVMLAVYLPSVVFAETVVRIGADVSIDADQTVNGDYYVSAGAVGNTIMTGTVNDDMYAFGGVVTINGTIHKDLSILAGSASVHGPVDDDVRIVGGEVTIAEHVKGDVFVIAGNLTVLSNAVIDGDVIFYGDKGEINGKVGGSILGSSQSMRVDAEVGKNIDIKTVRGLTLGDKAKIAGTVAYISSVVVTRAQNAEVVGVITQNKPQELTIDIKTRVRDILAPVFVSLFAALTLYLFFRKELMVYIKNIHEHTLKASLFGFGTALIVPIVALVLLVTVIGALVGIALFASWVFACVLGVALTGVVVGSYVSQWTTKSASVSLLWIVIGTCLVHGALLIPPVGTLLVVAFFGIAVGGLFLSFVKRA